MKVLIVDDEEVIREGMRRTIVSSFPDSSVTLASSGQEAYEFIHSQEVDVIFQDIMMPGMTGLELMAKVRNDYKNKSLRWIIVSAYSEFSYAQEALRHGARDYLLKPIGKDKLKQTLESINKEIEEEKRQHTIDNLFENYLQEAIFKRWARGLDIGCFELSKLSMDLGEFFIILIQLDLEDGFAIHHFAIENIMKELIVENGKGFVVDFGEKSVLGVFSPQANMSIYQFQNELTNQLENCLKDTFSILISKKLDDFNRIPETIQYLKGGVMEEMIYSQKPSGDQVIEIAMQYIRANYSQDISLEKVAANVFLNAVYFSQLFKQKTGLGYKDYVIQLRMEKAKELLKDSSMRISDVSELVGYSDMRHFTQVFKKYTSLTPTEFRNHS